ncbi:MAG: DUF308 domain-containing protein [Chlamydiota bacterium]|nr:DUF308 domain-containing protein [Chlamydiota bacterium]
MSEFIQKNRSLYIFESLIFILLGLIAIAVPALFTYSIEVLIGTVFLIGGLVQGYRTLKSKDTSSYIGSLTISFLSILVGLLLLAFPIKGIITITLLIAIILFFEGAIQLYLGFQLRDFRGWGWIVFSGFVSVVLAMMIWSELPGSASWVIGLLVGINMLIVGISQLLLVMVTPKVK